MLNCNCSYFSTFPLLSNVQAEEFRAGIGVASASQSLCNVF